MIIVKRYPENPILLPNNQNPWESDSVLNGCVVKNENIYHMFYRAISSPSDQAGVNMKVSTVGQTTSTDAVHFGSRSQFIKPEYEWEKYGCEDPRVIKLNDKYFIFYTALSTYPFSPYGIKVGVAITHDFKTIEEKHAVTTFNSKAMSIFPEKINGKIVGILTANTDMPPSKIGIAYFNNEEDIWSADFWNTWYSNLDKHILSSLQKDPNDQLELGSPPIRTQYGWLFIYCNIRNYNSPYKIFGIEAALLDLEDPLKLIGKSREPLLLPEKNYELYGNVPNVIFPSGAIIKDEDLYIYYGATDTTVCLATCKLNDLLEDLLPKPPEVSRRLHEQIKLDRYPGNPIITPNPDHFWESEYTFNPGTVWENGKVHIIYRAMGMDNTSVMGYASSKDGFHIDERLPEPIYVPRRDFEQKFQPGNSGCEDPRFTKINDRFYMCYTAYDGKNPTRVAMNSISVNDFINKEWQWEKPILISPPGMDDKDACILPKKVDGKFVFFHRLETSIWVDYMDDLDFEENEYIKGKILFSPRMNSWDNEKIGIGGVPIETENGWLMIYHGLSRDTKYRLGIALLDLENPTRVIARLNYPIFEPEAEYENKGLRFGTVFTNGSVVIDGKIFVYYGGADQVTCVATADFTEVMEKLKHSIYIE